METELTKKEEFLEEYGDDYGYPNGPISIDQLRSSHFNRLDANHTVYLDHAGATLYSELQMQSVFHDLTSNVYGNPHSQSDSSSATADIIREARQQVLDYCNASAKDYKCIFTSGATAALKLVGEAFPWTCQSCFMYTMENHNSVLGIREYALNHGASALAVDIQDQGEHASKGYMPSVMASQYPVQRRTGADFLNGNSKGDPYNLFAFPSECNFSGLRFSLDLVNLIKEDSERILGGSRFCKGRWLVLVDAAKGCATDPPDLSKHPADFVVISFYKLFGYPTGLGALIVQKDAAKLLKKTYFSGGTVAVSFADIDFVKRREGIEEFFEEGTSSFLSIASIRHGFKILNSLTAHAIRRHTSSLTMYVKRMLSALRHENGANVCVLYGSPASEGNCCDSGPVVSFNLKRQDGSWFGYREVEKLASLNGIQLRTGCFCNPGACAKFLGLSHQDLLLNLEAGHVCWDDNDVINGKPTGAIRISFGYMSMFEDAMKFIHFIISGFVSVPKLSGKQNVLRTRSIPFSGEGNDQRPSSASCYLRNITVYPIKSCAGFSVQKWPLISSGLLHDREWLIKSLSGEILTQKKVPEMCFIRTYIDLCEAIMFVESPRCRTKLQINLKSDVLLLSGREEIELRSQRYKVCPYDNDVNLWFSEAVGCPCTLLRSSGSSSSFSCLEKNRNIGLCRDVEGKLNFANEAQFLLISDESVSDLNNRLCQKGAQKGTCRPPVSVSSMQFRPNLVISGGEAYAEDGWTSLKIGKNYFTSLGGCNRCKMINVVHSACQVQKSNEPLATLASYRRVKGKIFFGILLRYETQDPTDSWLEVGQEVLPNID